MDKDALIRELDAVIKRMEQIRAEITRAERPEKTPNHHLSAASRASKRWGTTAAIVMLGAVAWAVSRQYRATAVAASAATALVATPPVPPAPQPPETPRIAAPSPAAVLPTPPAQLAVATHQTATTQAAGGTAPRPRPEPPRPTWSPKASKPAVRTTVQTTAVPAVIDTPPLTTRLLLDTQLVTTPRLPHL